MLILRCPCIYSCFYILERLKGGKHIILTFSKKTSQIAKLLKFKLNWHVCSISSDIWIQITIKEQLSVFFHKALNRLFCYLSKVGVGGIHIYKTLFLIFQINQNSLESSWYFTGQQFTRKRYQSFFNNVNVAFSFAVLELSKQLKL